MNNIERIWNVHNEYVRANVRGFDTHRSVCPVERIAPFRRSRNSHLQKGDRSLRIHYESHGIDTYSHSHIRRYRYGTLSCAVFVTTNCLSRHRNQSSRGGGGCCCFFSDCRWCVDINVRYDTFACALQIVLSAGVPLPGRTIDGPLSQHLIPLRLAAAWTCILFMHTFDSLTISMGKHLHRRWWLGSICVRGSGNGGGINRRRHN